MWVFNSGFSPLPGDHMVRIGLGGLVDVVCRLDLGIR